MISELISKLSHGTNLSYDETKNILSAILGGHTTKQQTVDFLSYLTDKGETDDELLGMLDVMEEYAIKISPKCRGKVIDLCGTGGDMLGTFNISTASAFVVAASGGIVAKHGNRSSSGMVGSADIFEYFGYDLDQSPEDIVYILDKFNLCFMFAQKFHPAMKNVASARKELKRRTAFNLLGPLSNPAGVKNQLIGVSSNEFLRRLPVILQKKGADIFEYFGYDLDQSPEDIVYILDKFNLCFMFAQKFHPAMKNVASARKELKRRTAFNLLGPLSNPAGVKNQLIGVSSNEFLRRLPVILQKKGAENIMTVISGDGLDEFSTSAVNHICLLQNGKISTSMIDPQTLGLEKSSLHEIQTSSKKDAVKAFVSVLEGTANRSMIDTTVLNSAAGLIIGDVAKDFTEGIEMAQNTIKNGDAFKLLKEFLSETGSTKLNEVQRS